MRSVLEQRPKLAAVDVETTGFGRRDRVVEIAIVALDRETWETVDEYDTLVNPERDVGPTGVHGITAGMVELAPVFADVLPAVARRLRGAVLIAHNLPFDTRMIRYEFERQGVPIEFGQGWCTLSATRAKLNEACQEAGIHLTRAHRALADARCTAELAKRLGFKDRNLPAHPTLVEGTVPFATPRTHRRGLADAEASLMHRVVGRSTYAFGDEATICYLDALDWVLDDGVIDRAERSEMDKLARAWGLTRSRQQEVHRAYFRSMVDAAERDGFVSDAEHRILQRIAVQLRVDASSVPEPTPCAGGPDWSPGMRICFTGQAMVQGRLWRRSQLQDLAGENGWRPVPSVTKGNCDVLVASDVSSASVKARTARKYGKPIVSIDDFLVRCRTRGAR